MKFRKGERVRIREGLPEHDTLHLASGKVGVISDYNEDKRTYTVWVQSLDAFYYVAEVLLSPLKTTHYDTHYQGDIQPIEIMQAQMTPEAFMGFLRGNILKYTCRAGKKDDLTKETAKILRYAEWLHKAAQGKKIDPRV